MNKEIIEYLELEIQMRKDGISTMVNSVHRDRLQKEIEKLNSWIAHLANGVEKSEATAISPLVNGCATLEAIEQAADKLTDDERMELIGRYCKYCRDLDNTCQCWNDE